MEEYIIKIAAGKGLEEWQVPVYVLEAGPFPSRVPAIHFSCGFCMEPWMYEEYLEGVYKGLEGKVNIFASGIPGHKIESDRGNVLNNNNRKTCVDLFHKIIEELDYGNDVNICHSAGPRTLPGERDTPEKYVLINSQVPVNYGALGFMWKCLKLYKTLLFDDSLEPEDKKYMKRTEHRSVMNFISNLRKNISFADEFKNLTIDELYPKVGADALLLFAGDDMHDDGLFKYNDITVAQIGTQFRNLQTEKMQDSDHGEVLCNPYEFIRLTVDFLRS